jgi:hypothetical protein
MEAVGAQVPIDRRPENREVVETAGRGVVNQIATTEFGVRFEGRDNLTRVGAGW